MRESTTYQAILEEGRQEGHIEGGIKELQRILMLQGTLRFGKPSAAIKSRLEEESGLERLEELAARLVKVNGWGELFD